MSRKVLEKLVILLELIERVDGKKIRTPFSDHGTVLNIKGQSERGRKLSTSQIYLINEIYKRYSKKEVIMKNRLRG